jgi:STE24 endopeptidase
MRSSVLTLLFVAALLGSLTVKLWLVTRQMRHVATHRDAVPADFAATISLAAHQKAADYTLAKGRFSVVSTALASALLLAWTLLGGLDVLNAALRDALQPRWGDMAYQLALVASFTLIGGALDLPLALYSVFRIEQRFGFNRMTLKLYAIDLAKELLLGALIGLPLLALILWIMHAAGSWWWLCAWVALTAFQLLLTVIYPIWIAPWFNKFEPLADASVSARVQALMQRCGFSANGLFVMDGSRRSAHSNAYFTGLGRAKRVVFFDTLLQKLSPGELEAVLAHELGHFKLRHVIKRTVLGFAVSLAGLALLGWLASQTWFYTALGVRPSLGAPNDALALLLFMLAVPPFAYFVSPLLAQLSRKHEFQADAYACEQASGADLASALLKLNADNASTLTPDPLYVRFYYSHPPASERLAMLKTQTA